MFKSTKQKKLAYKCAKCFKTDALKLAWFYGSDSCLAIVYYAINVLRNHLINCQYIKKEWAFYDK